MQCFNMFLRVPFFDYLSIHNFLVFILPDYWDQLPKSSEQTSLHLQCDAKSLQITMEQPTCLLSRVGRDLEQQRVHLTYPDRVPCIAINTYGGSPAPNIPIINKASLNHRASDYAVESLSDFFRNSTEEESWYFVVRVEPYRSLSLRGRMKSIPIYPYLRQ